MLIKNFLSVLFGTVLFTSCTQGYEEMDNAASLASAPGVAATLPLPTDVAAKMESRILVRLVANVKTGNLADAIEKKMDLVVPISKGGASSTTGQVNTELVFKSYTDSSGRAKAITAQDILTNITLTVYQGASDQSAKVYQGGPVPEHRISSNTPLDISLSCENAGICQKNSAIEFQGLSDADVTQATARLKVNIGIDDGSNVSRAANIAILNKCIAAFKAKSDVACRSLVSTSAQEDDCEYLKDARTLDTRFSGPWQGSVYEKVENACDRTGVAKKNP